MNSYDLNLALSFACMLAVLSFAAFHLGPALFRAIVQAIASSVQQSKTRARRTGPPGGALPHAAPQHWWGPHSSQ